MSKWAGKYIIGLTGNVGTGKSVVRKMLEHLGAYGIDADALSHRAIAKGAPGYAPILKTFGTWILNADGEIDRSRLGSLVFRDDEALKALERIVHPLVEQAVDLLIKRSSQSVVVVEAIKLLESNLSKNCDSIWVTYTPPEKQLERLMSRRGLSEADALQRIRVQSPQEKKMSAANVVIRNISTFADTWSQVSEKWQKTVPQPKAAPAPAPAPTRVPEGEMSIFRGQPRHSSQIANLINLYRKSDRVLTADDIMAEFGERAFLLLQVGQDLKGLIGLQVENLVARSLDLIIAPGVSAVQALPQLMTEVERASKDLQCEVSLVFVEAELARLEMVWRSLGYEKRTPQTLGVRAWQEAALESMPSAGATLYYKQLRKDRILRPI